VTNSLFKLVIQRLLYMSTIIIKDTYPKETRYSNSKLTGDFLLCSELVNIDYSHEHRFISQDKTGGDESTK